MPYTINGQSQSLAEPIEQDGVTYVPLATIVEVMGGYVTWDNGSKTARIELGDKKASVRVGDPGAEADGSPVDLPAPAMLEDSKVYVPVEFFQNALGLNIATMGSEVGISAS